MATFCIALFVLLMQFLWKNIDDLVGKGLDWIVISKLLFYVSASLVPMALPLAVLLSSLMTFGNMGEHYELVAFKSAGISLSRILRPLAFLILFVSAGAFLFSNYWLPYANLKSRSLLYDMRQQKPTLDLQAGYFSNDLDGYTIRVKDKKPVGQVERLYDVLIYDHTDEDNQNRNVITAKEGVMTITENKRFMELKLFDGTRYTEEKEDARNKKFPHSRLKFKENLIRFDLSQFKLNRTDEELFKNNYKMLNMGQLMKSIDTLENMKAEHIEKFKKGIKNSYFLYNNKQDQKAIIKAETVNFGRFFDQLSQRQKQQLFNTSSNMSRNSRVRVKNIADNKKSRIKFINRHKIEWHKKLSFSFACLVLFLIGAPFGAIIRKGGLGMPIVLAVIFFISFYMLSISGEQMVKENAVSAAFGMWFSTIVLFPIGIFLTIKATTDSSIFNLRAVADSLKTTFKKKST